MIRRQAQATPGPPATPPHIGGRAVDGVVETDQLRGALGRQTDL
jgi:hypothetical protein